MCEAEIEHALVCNHAGHATMQPFLFAMQHEGLTGICRLECSCLYTDAVKGDTGSADIFRDPKLRAPRFEG